MNKSALKKFATEARRELLERVELQARKVGITAEGIQKATIESSDAIFIDGKQLSEKERVQRNKLIARIRDIGFNRVMEETAYTWFNRFTALRFMEVNDYLPTRVRVLSSLNVENTEPDMMKEALSLELDLNKEYIYDLKLNNKNEELFKYLIIKHCNDLNHYMPFMFETIDDYTEILFPEGLLATDSFIRKMTNVEVIPESNWEKIEVIGWLYQYYIAEEKDRVFKAKKKYKAEEIPFATQLFTPDWIVRYMVQNSLGRYWVEAHPEHQDLISDWEFYLQNTEEDLEEKIEPYINKELKVEDIKCFDPAMGSGHILVYMFDVLFEIYSKSGYMEREIPRLIIENNLYGLDIDDRAYQLASFSVVMKAMEYNKRFLRSIEREGLTLNLASIQETNSLTNEDIEFLANDKEKYEETQTFIKQFQNAKAIGSLLKLKNDDYTYLQNRLKFMHSNPVTEIFEVEKQEKFLYLLPKLIKQTNLMSLEYDILITNPPYMSAGSMNKELSDYMKKNYPDSKADLFGAFMELNDYLKKNAMYAAINQQSWMFISRFKNLRKKMLETQTFENVLHLGSNAFDDINGQVVQTVSFIMRNYKVDKETIFIRTTDQKKSIDKMQEFKRLKASRKYSLLSSDLFRLIPDSPLSYWLDVRWIEIFDNANKLEEFGKPRIGLATGENEKFVRMWHEVDINKFIKDARNAEELSLRSGKWVPYNKGGTYRKWYGNLEYIVDWEDNGFNIKQNKLDRLKEGLIEKKNSECWNQEYYFKQGITWSKITAGDFSVRIQENGTIFDVAGCTIFELNDNTLYILGLLNSSIITELLKALSPTLNYEVGTIKSLPVIIPNDNALIDIIKTEVEECIKLSKIEWDYKETSWDFSSNVLLKTKKSSLHEAIEAFKENRKELIENLHEVEMSISNKFNQIYGFPLNETSEKIKNKKNVTEDIKETDLIKEFISYAVGCAVGRYSIDEEKLIYAGGKFDSLLHKTFLPDKDNIIPVLTGSYFEDDIVNKIISFVQVTFGMKNLEANLEYIANIIGSKNNETARETLRRYFLNDFYKDHIQVYKKRPIYWLFTSGKEKAFNCLIYLHRYDKTTLSRIRTDYLHEVQIRMDAEKRDLLNIINGNSTIKEITDAKKELKSLDKKIDELKAYDEKLHHMADMQIEIDLDDGVAVNYAKFEGLVAKI
ncbi:BREX-1 system adenine-specific DNA-methyltransferase PglX [Planococcus shenhongbingii]|uniref:BREX-1 system adenine-specific DNA-methyltransferase PglX n=1 Tax=Planococcus shenhongbingii TaxID=3058398 RepID=UPI00262F5800|nr:BREX-1 system adenine-specific DNA-methyltransferase PglX [Planococcus sp. N016]WKA56980.1 BREX-1 system adenine-specific DNA-methyltransferase PglX [Planococcus sp. N016]